ncbi:MAG: EAL domain-containing protein [Aquificae bacterium]|nr:EAL domain-containing protein [Aquificota bacterium]
MGIKKKLLLIFSSIFSFYTASIFFLFNKWKQGDLGDTAFVVSVLVLFLSSLFGVYLTVEKSVSSPIRRLKSKIKDTFSSEGIKPQPLKEDFGSQELNDLSKELEDLVEKLAKLLEESQQKTNLFKAIAENAPIGIFLYSQKFEYINPFIEKVIGYKKEEVVGKDIRFMLSQLDDRKREELLSVLERRMKGEFFKNRFQTKVKTKDGQEKDVLVISDTVKLDGQFFGLGIVIDITEIKNLERKLNELLETDALTGLLSRYGFTKRVSELIELYQNTKEKYFLIIVDISKFKVVNDTYGHYIGDSILKKVAKRLRNAMHKSDLIGRLAADEFGIFITKYSKFDDIAIIIDKIIEVIEEPIKIGEYTFNLKCSIGISVFPDDGKNVETLLKRAGMALMRAKEKVADKQQSSAVFFSKELEERIIERLIIEREMRTALKERPEEFYVEFQPIYNLNTLKIEKLEALVRWNSSRFGKVSPGKFIPIAEETRLIKDITNIVLQQVLDNLKKWRDEGIDVRVSVNISPVEFKDRDIVDRILSFLKPDRFERNISVEITESVLLDNVKDTREKIERFRAEGVEILLDDFGTGYSSLTYLKKFPITVLKIDREFMKELPQNMEDRGIVTTIIKLADFLSMDTVAEGIETEKQLNFLKNSGCKYGQGFFFSKPLPAKDIEEKLLAEKG